MENKEKTKNIPSRSNLIKIKNASVDFFRKYIFSKAFFIFFNILAILISSSIIILNLFSIRFNPFPKETLTLFVLIAVFSVFITLLIGINTLLAIQDKKSILNNNIQRAQEIIDTISEKDDLDNEDVEAINEILN
ncbi:hypothetical protein H9M94_01420 [Mycoplasma sp. Pen4]|uniref:hypothetical protein n=1 Tax=Mycoplasma sp. Pen4 TaxID=640330 RepID=UPI0016542C0F|nr:hypothetical protein [Mycoplasma sp. Pen4]QNM93915.1 hypothetical protein H9M94_01420 [Mycoplasma sp. Pen4]